MAEYKPGLPRQNDNISHQSPLREFFILLLGLAGLLFMGYWVLGLMVDAAVSRISYEDEAVLFEGLSLDWGTQLESDISTSDEKLQSLVDGLRECSVLPVPIHVSMLANEAPNAVALPGGNMLVFDGLQDYVQSENGMAFVLAHELGHFIDRDHLRGMGRGIVVMSFAALLTGPDSGLSALLMPGFALNTARFSQQREALADQKALEILSCYYGHTSGATEFFRALKDSPLSESGQNHYFDSHPQLDDRIEAIESWRVEHQDPEGKTRPWQG